MSDGEPGPGLLRRADALAGGLSDAELARLVRRGELERLQRGTYLAPGIVTERHRLVVTATVHGLRRPGIVSHGSAGVLHGLPLWGVPLARVHLIRRPPAAESGSARVHLHVTRVPDDQVTVVDGLVVTDPTRTVVDLARTVGFEDAVVTADATLAARLTSKAALEACLDDMGPVPGARRAARVLGFADARSESVGESRSRVLVRRLGLPAPDLQVPVHHEDGGLIGRSDFGWHDRRTLAEFDGRVKYGRLLRPGQQPGDAVFEEKLREDEMRDAGWQMARWTWAELDRPSVVGARLRRAFARGTQAA